VDPPSSDGQPESRHIVNDIQTYAEGRQSSITINPTDSGKVSGKQTDCAAEMLQAWVSAKKSGSVNQLVINMICTGLGFNTLNINVTQIKGQTWVALTTEPIKDREHCPLADFGSVANGRYRILCVWNGVTEAMLLSHVGDTSHKAPVIVFYFDHMTEKSRRTLASLCRQQKRTFIVLDETVIHYLSSEPEPRLRTMFECTLPFTYANPYNITAGYVPIEMFYGRDRARRSIMDPMGPSLVYGGRRMGKTSLLRDVECRFNEQHGHAAVLLDLASHGWGTDRNIDGLWSILASSLSRCGIIIPPGAIYRMNIKKLIMHVQRWLDQDKSRRLLLLFDEADSFLTFDGNYSSDELIGQEGSFINLRRLRFLTTETQGRFKVIFSGLHNVQRMNRHVSSPLPHYGDALCIGPLFDNGEWRDAHELVRKPLGSLGYNFETPDLVTRILSLTSYYPSLIQLFCKHLLGHLTETYGKTSDTSLGPPYVITARHIDEVYLSLDLRRSLRDRFVWTLQLDQRYEVIAYLIALNSVPMKDSTQIEGLTISKIQREALHWWPEGFAQENSEAAFRALLDELVGMGILRITSEHRYALRDINVATLMGTQEEVEATLRRPREALPS
jgi:hypothetical protein